MRDNLRLHHRIRDHVQRFLPPMRVTRQRNLALLMTGLVLARRVHLDHIVRKWPVHATRPSLANRLRRLLSNPRLDPVRLYEPVARMLLARLSGAPVRLILDVTKIGFRHRMLTVAVAYRKRALPLAWSVHRGRRGHVTQEAQKALLERARLLLPPGSRVVVTGDSAFSQVPLMRYLTRVGWGYVLRVAGRYKVVVLGRRDWIRVDALPLREGETRLVGAVAYTEQHVYRTQLVLHRARGEAAPWLLVCSDGCAPGAVRAYRVRMWTEALYGDLKGHGFDLEATHLDDAGRLSRLVLAVFLVYVWLMAVGSDVVRRGLRPLVDRRSRRDKSYFRVGWDYLEHRLRLGEPIPIRFEPHP